MKSELLPILSKIEGNHDAPPLNFEDTTYLTSDNYYVLTGIRSIRRIQFVARQFVAHQFVAPSIRRTSIRRTSIRRAFNSSHVNSSHINSSHINSSQLLHVVYWGHGEFDFAANSNAYIVYTVIVV